MLRIDYAPDFDSLAHMDMAAQAKERWERWRHNCEWLMGSFGWEGKGYYTSFQTPEFPTWPGYGQFDYLREYTPHAHKYGVRVLSYLNMHWFSYEFAEQNPGWEQITSSGVPYGRVVPLYGNGTTFCVNSPWRDWAFRMMREAMKTGIDGLFLDGPLVYADCCYCPSCQALFRERFGSDIPQEDWTDPLWREHIGFREDSLARFLADAQATVLSVNPEGAVFLNAGSWNPGGWRYARDIQKLGPHQTFNGAEAFFHHGRGQDIYEYLIASKYLRAGMRPSVVFMHYMNGNWHYRVLDPGELKLGIAQTVAGGSNPWLALIASSMQSQPDAPEQARELYGFLDDNKRYYTGMESMAQVAVLFSTGSGQNYFSRWETLYSRTGGGKEENLVFDMTTTETAELSARKRQCESLIAAACAGYFQMLTRSHIPFDVILDQDLTNGKLARYKALVLPDAVCLSPEAAQAVRAFVAGGGALLASFEAGMYDMQGEPTDALLETLGLERVEGAFPVFHSDNYSQATHARWGFHDGCLIERSPYALKVRAREGTDVAALVMKPVGRPYVALEGLSDHPAVVISQDPARRVIYFAEAVGAFYHETHMTTTEMRVVGALRELVGEGLVEVSTPATVSVDVYRQPETGMITIHLVNNTVDTRPVREFLPVHDIEIRLRLQGGPQSVRGLREGAVLGVSYADDLLAIRLPRLEMYEVIAVEP